MRRSVLFSLLSLGSLFAAEGSSPSALLDQVIVQPGVYDQMCAPPSVITPAVPLPIYQFVVEREMHPSPEDIARLRARRAEVVPVLVGRLAGLDLAKAPPKVPEIKFKPDSELVETSGISPKELSGLMLEIVVALDAVEALPALLDQEEKLRALISAAEGNDKAPTPGVRLDGYIAFPTGKKQLSKRDQQLLQARVFQREMLSVMLQLLRRQRYQPLLESAWEKKYVAAIRERAKEKDLRDIKSPADLAANHMEGTRFDPIVGVPLGYIEKPPVIPFSRESREQIRGWAAAFMKDVPRDQWRVNPVDR